MEGTAGSCNIPDAFAARRMLLQWYSYLCMIAKKICHHRICSCITLGEDDHVSFVEDSTSI